MKPEHFLDLPPDTISEITRQAGRPKVGVFVPDGNRRLVLATTDLPENSPAFFTQVALTQTAGFLENLKVFFNHGLPTLFAPLFSRSVLLRGGNYRLAVIETLRILFTDPTWLDFYRDRGICVRVYGNVEALCCDEFGPAIAWIKAVELQTKGYTAHHLYLGIGGEPWVGHDAAAAAVRFYGQFNREPDNDELIPFLYGWPVPAAAFVIISSKFAGIGALPALITGHDTQLYYLPVPGVIGLTERTYRLILYDLLFSQQERPQDRHYELSPEERGQLRAWYTARADTVIGLGRKIGSVWVPDIGLEGKPCE
jgi:hypothetical protein